MRFIYRHACLPAGSRDLVSEANSAAARLWDRLTSAGVHGPRMDESYRTRFYERHLSSLASKLQNCAHHVIWAMANTGKALSDVTLVDHGGGLGLIALLAKEMGVRRVIYNDIDAKFVEAAQGIAGLAGAPADQYIVGDIGSLVDALGDTGIDALVSYDVLEHIYDVDSFFATLCRAPCCPRVLFMSSGANMFSPRYLLRVIPLQRGLELLNSCKRTAIIRDYAPNLSEEQIVALCRSTRMLVRCEIESVVERYLENGRVERPQKTGANACDPFRSNTVDPETGWWAEHLLSPFYLCGLLRCLGFTAKVMPGFYGGRGSFLNPVVGMARGAMSLPIAAFYTLHAVRRGSSRIP